MIKELGVLLLIFVAIIGLSSAVTDIPLTKENAQSSTLKKHAMKSSRGDMTIRESSNKGSSKIPQKTTARHLPKYKVPKKIIDS